MVGEGGSLEVFKDFQETIEPFCIPRRDSVRIRINKEAFGGGGQISTNKNHAANFNSWISVWL